MANEFKFMRAVVGAVRAAISGVCATQSIEKRFAYHVQFNCPLP